MTTINLGKDTSVDMHGGTGEDALKILAVRAKIQPYLEEYNQVGGWTYQEHYAMCVAQTDAIHGIDLHLPDWMADGPELAQGFRDWLRLPKKRLELWIAQLNNLDEEMNDPALLPTDKLAAKGINPQDPLSQSAGQNSE